MAFVFRAYALDFKGGWGRTIYLTKHLYKGVFMKSHILATLMCLMLFSGAGVAQEELNLEAFESQLQELVQANSELLTVSSIGKSTTGRDIWVVTVAAAGKIEPDMRPAMLIGANVEGYRISATQAAIATLEQILASAEEEAVAQILATRTLYVVPIINPDMTAGYFTNPLSSRTMGLSPMNEDADDETDEDGADDLNGDGYITMMRYRHPEGTMMIDPDDARLMKEADRRKGEVGEYKVVQEGIDNDNDGSINEDGAGGVALNMNFPHDYQYFADGAGPHPVSEGESRAILDFMLEHRNIAAVLVYGEESNLLNLRKGKQAGQAGSDKIKVPERFAEFLGLDPDVEYDIDELVELIKATPIGRQVEVTRERVLQFLGTGPSMSIQDGDFPYYEKLSEVFKEMVKEAELPERNAAPTPVMGDGSFATWAYYHYGVPTFASSVWGIPKLKKEEKKEDMLTIAQLKEMTSEEFIALGEEKIQAFLEASGAAERINAARLISMVEGGQVNPKMMAQMMEAQAGAAGDQKAADGEGSLKLAWMAENLANKGFVEWTEYEHPTLGTVEIGGEIPMALEVVPAELLQPALAVNAQFAVKLAGSLASIQLSDVAASKVSEGVYEITGYVVNNGFLPTSSAQGIRAMMAPPVIVTMNSGDARMLTGSKIVRFASIEGHGLSPRMRWVVQAEAGSTIEIEAVSQKCGTDSVTLTLK